MSEINNFKSIIINLNKDIKRRDNVIIKLRSLLKECRKESVEKILKHLSD